MTANMWLHVVVITLALVLPDYVGAQSATRTVIDMAQREVTLPRADAQGGDHRICSGLNSLMFAMGAGDMLVNGLPEPFARQQRWKYQTVFAPTMANKPQLQGPDRAPDYRGTAHGRARRGLYHG